MLLRNRLLIAFSTVAFVVVCLFAVLAYQISIDSKNQTEARFLQHFLDEFESILEPSLQKEITDITEIKDLDNVLQFVDENEHLILVHGEHSHSFGKDVPELNNAIDEIIQQQKNSGKIIVNDRYYVWGMRTIGKTDYSMILYHSTEDYAGFIENSAVWERLLITAIIIFWITVWAALILSSWMAKNLNKQNQKIIYQATHDSLTELPNRSFLYAELEKLIKSEKEKGTYLALYFMDLDGFKELNNTLGHTYGDTLLKLLAIRLSPEKIQCKLIARMGGDEFAILKIHNTKEEIQEYINLIESKLVDPISFDGIEYQIRKSIGVAIFPSHGNTPETIIQHAEVAMYKAKDTSKNHAIYTKEDNPNSVRRLKLISELHTAVKNSELQVYYQPKIDLQNGKIHGVEALVRWQHPQLGFISPAEFIPLAEHVGLIGSITRHVLSTTIKNWNKWHEMGIELHVAVNISSNEFENPSLPSEILGYLKDWNMPASFLTLEITESVMMGNINNTLSLLQHLRDINIKLSIDDFGTGFSSLAYLRQLPFSELKIDRSFIMDMTKHQNNLHIVKTVINLAHSLNFNVVAEGIEDQSTYNELKVLGCNSAQGFYMAKPMPADELEKWCLESEWGTDSENHYYPVENSDFISNMTSIAESFQKMPCQKKFQST